MNDQQENVHRLEEARRRIDIDYATMQRFLRAEKGDRVKQKNRALPTPSRFRSKTRSVCPSCIYVQGHEDRRLERFLQAGSTCFFGPVRSDKVDRKVPLPAHENALGAPPMRSTGRWRSRRSALSVPSAQLWFPENTGIAMTLSCDFGVGGKNVDPTASDDVCFAIINSSSVGTVAEGGADAREISAGLYRGLACRIEKTRTARQSSPECRRSFSPTAASALCLARAATIDIGQVKRNIRRNSR